MTGTDPLTSAWERLRRLTPARIALGRTGSGLPTDKVLAFAMAHAQARDAVHSPFDAASLAKAVQALGLTCEQVASAAPDKELYLRRPDFGRRLCEADRDRWAGTDSQPSDLALVVGDGLSATAVHNHALALLQALLPALRDQGLRLAPATVATGARVALGDEIGALLQARMVLMLIGERPGLSSPDSLGAYLTFEPKLGRTDAERNCVSNIRHGGLPYDLAAFRLAWLIEAAFKRQLTGVHLKDQSETALEARPADPLLGDG